MKDNTLLELVEMLTVPFIILIGAVMVFFCSGCTSTGEFDARGFADATNAVNTTYTNYDRAQHPERYPVYPYPYQPISPVHLSY